MGVFNKIFGRKDKTNGDIGQEQTTNNVGVVNRVKSSKEIDKEFMGRLRETNDVARAREDMRSDIIDAKGWRPLADDIERRRKEQTLLAVEKAHRLLGKNGHEKDVPRSDVSASRMDIERQQRSVVLLKEYLEVIRSSPEMYAPEDIAKAEEELITEQRKLEILTGKDSQKTTIGDGENALKNKDEWKQEWIEGYDTPQEEALKDIMRELKKAKWFDEEMYKLMTSECFGEEKDWIEIPPKWEEFNDKYNKIAAVYSKLQQMLNECKQRRIQLHITTDPEPNERKLDKFGNPTELTPREFATQQIEKLIREGVIEPEIAWECNVMYFIDDDEHEEINVEDAR